jgi:hypothetical protein
MSAPSERTVPSGPRSRERRAEPPRDQATSTFTEILTRLLAATPGAYAVALVDFEGETVDYAGRCDTFELKIAAAHWNIVLGEIAEAATIGPIHKIVLRAREKSYVVRRIHEGYSVVVLLHRHAAFAVSDRALAEADARLSVEAGWPTPPTGSRWFYVEVEALRRNRFRPTRLRVEGAWHPVEVMGALMGLGPREKGYRVRLPSGAEMMLVRERLGTWFADERVD